MRCIAVLSILMLPLTVAAEVTSEDAVAAMRAGDYERAISLFSALADEGDRRAMNTIGTFYYEGQGVEKDYALAMEWWMRALPDADAIVNIGVLYRDGLGVDQNLEMAYAIFLLIYANSTGGENTQIRNGRNLMKAVQVMSQDQINTALCYSPQRVQAFIESRGTDSDIGGVAIKDQNWWLDGELPDIDCSAY